MGELLPEELEMAGFVPRNPPPSLAEGRGKGPEEEGLVTQKLLEAKAPDGRDQDSVSIVTLTEMDTMERETWGKKVDFLLSVIGFAVDLANVWRFPYLCFKNGGGVFLIPYGLMLIFGGIPLFYMELALGQYYRQGAITTWGRVCPLFKGIGYGVVMIAFYVDFFYNVIISWALRYFINSFRSPLPWATCNNSWNSPYCYEPTMWALGGDGECRNSSILGNDTAYVSSTSEYFYKEFMHIREINSSDNRYIRSAGNPGPLKWDSTLCLMAVYLICYFSLWKGIKMSGKVVWFTALFPYCVLFILLIRGVTLPGATVGLTYYLSPNMTKLQEGQVWVDAATQVFFSLGPGFGVLLAYASYNPFHNNVYQDALMTSMINCATSFLSGFVIFSVLGYMSCKSGLPIDKVADQGPGLVFVVYPEALSTVPWGANVFSLIFFMMLLTLGLDSSFGGSEAIITALSDEWPVLKKRRELFVACLFSVYMLIGLVMCTEGGVIFVDFLDANGASSGLLICVFCEALTISWVYGLRRFVKDIKEMIGSEPGYYWRFCWAIMGPGFMLYNVIYGFLSWEPQVIPESYDYPDWMNALGLTIALSPALAILIVGMYQFYKARGRTLCEKLETVVTPWKDRQTNYTAGSVGEGHTLTFPYPPAQPTHL